VVEIGPGKGALTAHLLDRADRVVAVEIDPILVQYLRAKFRGHDRLEVLEGDILKVDPGQWGPAVIAGNLPYYIASPIIGKVLSLGAPRGIGATAESRRGPVRAVFLVQKEVAQRLTASPGSRDYGYLTVATQFFADVEYLFAVPPAAFHPAPKVESAVVRLTPRRELPAADPAAFLGFVSLAFQHKRKTLRNNLVAQYDRAMLDALPEGKLRAEQMSLDALLELYRRLRNY
jgi:16S rRNA (adenine1518-N6/adenine1519-N6)-dimethyltransferase